MNPSKRQYALWAFLLVALVGLAVAALLYVPGKGLFGGGPGGEVRGQVEGGTAVGGLTDLGEYGTVPAFDLVAHTGDEIRLADLAGQVWIADFIFTSCKSTCPLMTAQMKRVDGMLGDDRGVRLVSFSVDPERDTPQRLAEFAAQYGASERWLFLTGDKPQLRRLAIDGFHLATGDAPPADVAQGAEIVLHSTRFVLVDRRGRIRGYYSGTDGRAVDQMVKDARRLMVPGAG